MKEQQHIVSCLVNNHSGVLTKISGLFSRRGYNIESLSVCATQDSNLSRMTIVVNGDEYILKQITKQLGKLYDVKRVTQLTENDSVFREMLLLKLKHQPEQLSQILEICKVYKAKAIDLSPNSMVIELTGDSVKLDAFIKVMIPYGMLEMVRTGVSALHRGELCIKQLQDYSDLF